MKSVLLQWHLDPFVFVFIFVALVIYLQMQAATKKKNLFFSVGIMLFIIATASPLHYLAMEYYFSAHMITHILILLLAGPFIVAGLPGPLHQLKTPALFRISKLFYFHPWIAWVTGVSVMWVWHIPAIYRLTHADRQQAFSLIPVLHSGCLLLAGIIFSWPIFGPIKKLRIHSLSGIVYLFTACISCSLLGLLITFAPANMYSSAMENMSMIAKKNNPWNLTQTADQQVAGLIMWVPCCLVYLSGCFILLAQWFNEKKLSNHLSQYSID